MAVAFIHVAAGDGLHIELFDSSGGTK